MRRNAGLLLAAVVLVAAGIRLLEPGASSRRGAESPAPVSAAPAAPAPPSARGIEDAVARAFRERRSGVWLETAGRVSRVLTDDEKGARHQRFILALAGGTTVLVAHNIDVAARVEGIAAGDEVSARGLYVWNDQGGVLHWTHHDPEGRRTGGWIRHRGRRYE